MTATMSKSVITVVFLGLAATGLFEATFSEAALSDNYYDLTCPNATYIVATMVQAAVHRFPGLAPKLLRMHFHDCFVRGCDGSVLIYKSDHTAERDGIPNKNSLSGFNFIETVKAALEAVCARTVSCADIVALAARDAVTSLAALSGQMGNFTWDVQLGRKDGNISNAIDTFDLPNPLFNYSVVLAMFAAKGLNESQMVVLSGSHTIGTSECRFATGRYGDPALNATYKAYLEKECPNSGPNDFHRIAMKDMTDSKLSTNYTFDNYYYKNLNEGKGLFVSDAALVTNSSAARLVSFYADSRNAAQFVLDFGAAMIAMGTIGVRTEGQVRTNCSNSAY